MSKSINVEEKTAVEMNGPNLKGLLRCPPYLLYLFLLSLGFLPTFLIFFFFFFPSLFLRLPSLFRTSQLSFLLFYFFLYRTSLSLSLSDVPTKMAPTDPVKGSFYGHLLYYLRFPVASHIWRLSTKNLAYFVLSPKFGRFGGNFGDFLIILRGGS